MRTIPIYHVHSGTSTTPQKGSYSRLAADLRASEPWLSAGLARTRNGPGPEEWPEKVHQQPGQLVIAARLSTGPGPG
jgi:hypothetical protein